MSTSSSSKKSRVLLSEINVTPFVDVMLVLLIIFMVTTPMMQQGLEVELPETNSGGITVPEEPLILVIKKNKKFFIGSAQFHLSNIGKKIVTIVKNRKDKRVYIQADKSVEYGLVAKTLAEMRSNGLLNISLITTFKKKK